MWNRAYHVVHRPIQTGAAVRDYEGIGIMLSPEPLGGVCHVRSPCAPTLHHCHRVMVSKSAGGALQLQQAPRC
jgi:hypothetical protein